MKISRIIMGKIAANVIVCLVIMLVNHIIYYVLGDEARRVNDIRFKENF